MALKEDLRERGLRRGQVGTVVELQALPYNFAQFGDGQGISSTLILVNPSVTDTAEGTVSLLNAEGSPILANINGMDQAGSFSFNVPPKGASYYATGGSARLVVGSAQLVSSVPVNGTILFGGNFGLAGVAGVEPFARFLVPIEMNRAIGVSTGVAIFNSNRSPANVALRLRQASGVFVPNGGVEFAVNPNSQLARFPDELFSGRGIDLSNFRGTLEISSTLPVNGMAVRVSPGELATLPVIPIPPESDQLYFPQFGDGQGISSTLILVNPSNETATGTASLSGIAGQPLAVDINGLVRIGSFPISIPPGGIAFYATDGLGEPVVGSVEVKCSTPLGGVILFSGPLGVAGVGASQPVSKFLVPIESAVAGGVRSGVAISNPNDFQIQLTLTLRDFQGVPVPDGSAQVPLLPRGQVAKFAEEFFEGRAIDLSSFRGTLEVEASAPVNSTAIRVSPRQFATLPVTEVF